MLDHRARPIRAVKDEIWKTYSGQSRDGYTYSYNRVVGPACRR